MITKHPLAIIAALAGVYLIGDLRGAARTTDHYEAEKTEARLDAAEKYAVELSRATDASLANQGVSIELMTTMHVHRTRSEQLIREVHADVDAHPDLDACLVPDATRRLRDEQVADSARAAADHPAVRR